MIKRDSLGKFVKGNTYWLGRKGKKPNSGSFKKSNLSWNTGNHTIKKCIGCGVEFSTNKKNLTRPHQLFCSRGCFQQYRHLNNNQPLCLSCGEKVNWGGKYCIECYKGENHHWWQGGITPLNFLIRSSSKYLNWRKKCFERDDYTCQKCGQISGYLEVHHIKPFSKFPEERFNLSNGITFCRKCHKTMDTVKRGVARK